MTESPPPREASAPDLVEPIGEIQLGLDDLAVEAVERIRRFLAERAMKGGSSPADIAALYTAPGIVDDSLATHYLDRQFVHNEIPADWRALQDRIASAFARLPTGAGPAEILAVADAQDAELAPRRSIFDDPDDDEDDLSRPLTERDPALADLTLSSRLAVERIIIEESLANGIAPVRYMELRELLASVGDERSLQYLDLPYERGERPEDWDTLRDQAMRIRQRMDERTQDPLALWHELLVQLPDLEPGRLLILLEQRLDQGR